MNSHKGLICISFLFIAFFTNELISQCYPDRHNSNMENLWLSCTKSNSPNPNSDKSHWVLYEFDGVKRVSGIQFWNINHPDHLNSGAKSIRVDYKTENGEWKQHDGYTLEKGDGSGFYEGETFVMLEHLITDHVLLTILDNHGGQCAGLAEVKFSILSNTTPTEDISEDHFDITISPNPFYHFTSVSVGDLEQKEICYEIINNLGQIIQKNVTKTLNGKANFDIMANSMPAGNYFLKITDGLRVSSRKLSHQSQ